MIACVAAGTGFAIVPQSVLQTLQATQKVNQHTLPEWVARNQTHLVWRGDPSRALEKLIHLVQPQDMPGAPSEALQEAKALDDLPKQSGGAVGTARRFKFDSL
jgi:hypothetical protein